MKQDYKSCSNTCYSKLVKIKKIFTSYKLLEPIYYVGSKRSLTIWKYQLMNDNRKHLYLGCFVVLFVPKVKRLFCFVNTNANDDLYEMVA